MIKRTLIELRHLINEYAKSQKLEILDKTSTVSWLYPGQFAYCLNEEFIWKRYGTFINCPEEVHFQKIQQVIRWDDFEKFFLKNQEITRTHLGNFDMSTVNGGHIIPKERVSDFSSKSFVGLIDFLVNIVGLEKKKFVITYFPGGKLSQLSKNKRGDPGYNFDFNFPEDEESVRAFIDLGIKESQIIPDSTRNCFLLPKWACGELAPWGYRNEIHYQTDNGLLDIATIEILPYKPIVEDGDYSGVEIWDKCFIINGIGLERLSMLINNSCDIFEIDNIKPLFSRIVFESIDNPVLICESIRIFHRLVSDTGGNMYDYRSKKPPRDRQSKFNVLRRVLYGIDQCLLRELFDINAEINPWYPELRKSVDSCLISLAEYKETQRDFKDKRKEKK